MPNSVNRRAAPAIALLAAAIAGCGAAPNPHPPKPRLAPGRAGSSRSVLELVAARPAALAFATSYVASANHPRHPLARSATDELARELLGNAATNGRPRRGPRLHLRALALGAKADGQVEATMTLGAGHGPSFAVTFFLQSHGRRWLALRLIGN